MASYEPQSEEHRAWARVRLNRGRSAGALWEIDARYPEARLTLGADPGAGWPIEAPGVQPLHCELFWDGRALWVADTADAGGVFLDGQRVRAWAQISGPAEIRFGQAAVDVETSPPAGQEMISQPADARPVTVTDMKLPPQRPSDGMVFGGAAAEDLEGAATKMVTLPKAASDLDAERARLAAARQASPDASVDALRPRLGGAPMAPTSEATRMAPIPAPPPGRARFVGSPPRAPAPPPAIPASPPMAPPPAPLRPPAPEVSGGFPSSAPSAVGSPDPMMSGSFVAPPTDPRARLREQKGLAGLKYRFAALLGREKTPPSEPGESVDTKQSLPTRTWILLAVTVLAAVALLLWEEEPVAEPAGPPPMAVGEPPSESAEPPAPAPAEPEVEPTSDSVEVAATAPDPVASDEDEDLPSRARRAADHFIHGRHAEALPLYRALSLAHPEDRAYASMVRILERRLGPCVEGRGADGRPCAPPNGAR